MASWRPADTSEAAHAAYLEGIRALPPAERVMRALQLSALVRSLVRDGAVRTDAGRGEDSQAQCFLRRLHGPEEGDRAFALMRSAE